MLVVGAIFACCPRPLVSSSKFECLMFVFSIAVMCFELDPWLFQGLEWAWPCGVSARGPLLVLVVWFHPRFFC
jgi:hypothetical protein